MATLSQWVEGARPRTLPAAVAPVLVGTGAAFALSRANAADALLALLVSLALQVGRQLRQRLLRRDPRHRPRDGSGRSGWSGNGSPPPPTSSWRRCLCFGAAAVVGLALVALSEAGGCCRRRGLDRGGLVLHRRQAALRLQRLRRAVRLRLLRAWSPRWARCTPRPLRLDLAGVGRRRRHRRAGLRDPGGQQPARHPRRRRQRQAHPGRAAGRPRHPGPLRRPARASPPSPWWSRPSPTSRPCWRWRRSGSPGRC